MGKIRIGILSDTHGLLRDEVVRELTGCSAILHGGDKEWAQLLPLSLDFELYGLRIYMTHKKKDLPSDTGRYDLVIYGHSHRYEIRSAGKTVFLNPGSCGPRRFNQEITLAVLVLDPSSREFTIRRIDIPHEKIIVSAGSKDIRKTIIGVMKETEKGTSVEEIAGKLKIDPQLAEQICRLYLTHPGVTADGIMTKMGL